MTTGGFSGAGTNFTTRIITNPDADIAQDRIVTATGAYNATAPLSGSAAWVMQVATFRAAGAPTGDTTPPTVAITAPTGTVSGTVTITANATDNVGRGRGAVPVDNNPLAAEDTTSPYSVSWNTTTVANGTHTLTALARDINGNTATSAPVTITVANGHAGTFRTRFWRLASIYRPRLSSCPTGACWWLSSAARSRYCRRPIRRPTPHLPAAHQCRQRDDGTVAQQGIYDIALDPNFATNRFYYVSYTANTPNRDRLSRFTANATLTGTVPGSELIIYQDPQDA